MPIALGVTFLTFMLIHLIPGDPALTILGNKATPWPRIALLHKKWGLDKPLPVQYLKFLGRVVHGDLGTSLFYGVNAGHAGVAEGRGDVVPDRLRAACCR